MFHHWFEEPCEAVDCSPLTQDHGVAHEVGDLPRVGVLEGAAQELLLFLSYSHLEVARF